MSSETTTPPAPAARKLADKLFLGPEFITWLYFFLIEQNFEVVVPEVFGPPRPTIEELADCTVQFAIGKRTTLRTLDGVGARDALTGPGLDDNGEVLQAIRRGALITVLSLECSIQSRVYAFTLDAMDGGITGLKLPDLFTEPDEDDVQDPRVGPPKRKRRPKLPLEDVLALRSQCTAELLKVVDVLFATFIARRLERAWHTNSVPDIRARVRAGLESRRVDA